MEYLPFKQEGNDRWTLLDVSFCVDFGGRQAECTFQNSATKAILGASYFPLERKWSEEFWNTADPISSAIHRLFYLFDTTSKVPE